MNDSLRGVGAIVAIGLVSGVVGAAVGWLPELQELSGPPQIPRLVTLQSREPASRQVRAADDSGGRHKWVGNRPPHPQQSAKEDAEVSGAPSSDSLEGRAASFVTAQVAGWSSANALNLASIASAYAEEIFYYGAANPDRQCCSTSAASWSGGPSGAITCSQARLPSSVSRMYVRSAE